MTFTSRDRTLRDSSSRRFTIRQIREFRRRSLREVGLIGYKMAADLEAAGIAGVATNSTYDTWWHGGFRTAPYFHNSIGILSEAASASLMTPVTVKREDLARNRTTRGLARPADAGDKLSRTRGLAANGIRATSRASR